MAGSDQDWRKSADTHKMSSDEVRRAGVEASKRPPGTNPGENLHQRRKLPYNLYTLTLGGIAIVGSLWYFTLYNKKKPEATAGDVARVSTGAADPQDTRPRK